jgi:hypothetical protein
MPGPIRKPLVHHAVRTIVQADDVALFREGLQLRRRRHRSDDDRRAYSAAASRLDRALGVRLWQTPVLDTVGMDAPPDWMDGAYEISCWHASKEVEQQLRQALAAQRARAWAVTTPSPPEPALP